jgi:hypothetical protein
MKLTIVLFIVFLLVNHSYSQQIDTLTNDKIIKLHKAGFGKEILKSKIQNSPANFDVSMDGMLNLKKEGVPEDVINTMVSKPQKGTSNDNSVPTVIDTKLEQGIYYLPSSNSEKVEIEPTVLTSSKSSAGWGAISGVFNSTAKATLSGDEAALEITEMNPKFLFVFDTLATNDINASRGAFSNVKSPNEFVLVKLEVRKNARELIVGKGNNFKASNGIDNDQIRSFGLKKISKGIYEVQAKESLSNGEYCFMFASGIRQGEINKVFDFSIKQKKGF